MSAFKMNSVVGALAFATAAYAHGHVDRYNIGGEDIVGGVSGGLSRSPQPDSAAWLANNADNGFVRDPTSPDIICHLGGVPGSSSVEIAAGETMTVHWDQWPESHAGPVIDYLAPVGGEFASISKSSLEFVKIAEAGLSGGSWAALELLANGNTWPITIPSSVAPGNYVLRHEIIALHEGDRPSGTQFYPQCINIVVTGSGTNSLSGGTPATQLYTATDPGVLFNMYNNPTSYPIPGPELMAGGSSGSPDPVTTPVEEDDEETTTPPTTPPVEEDTDAGSPAPVPTTPPVEEDTDAGSPAPVPTTLQTSTTPPSATATGGAGSGVAGRWNQCGGINFGGPTTCEAGTTCQEQNPYYFQCL